jgi:cytoskeletal protein RodZ
MSGRNSEQPKPPEKDEEERDRRAANIFLLVAAVVLIGVGIWLADAMIAAKKADNCLSSGRRNCNPIDVPPR